VLHVSYMLENEPFKKLPVPYQPIPKLDHCPPTLRFGFAFPEPFVEFRRVALENNLGEPEEFLKPNTFYKLRTRVVALLNNLCGFEPPLVIYCEYIHSKEADVMLEISTNYALGIPEDKVDVALRTIKELFSLPDDTKPKWYLELGIFEKARDEYLLPMSAFIWSRCDQDSEDSRISLIA
ncbi:hypothetical protein BJ322DRAFT_1070939, partial [Thelephora terrestris]